MSYQNPSTFAPYSPPPDETKSKRASQRYAPIPSTSSAAASGSAPGASPNPFAGVYQTATQPPPGQIKVNTYETTMPIRVDLAAALTYVFGCITGVFFLIFETKNDYVRFHAWQSSLIFAPLFFFQFIIGFISSLFLWVLLVIEIALIVYLSYRAYLDGATLNRYEVPFFGPLASLWVDTE